MRVTCCLVKVYLRVSVSLGTNSAAIFLHRSQRGNIPHRYFEIEGGAFMCAPLEAGEPKNYQEIMKSLSEE